MPLPYPNHAFRVRYHEQGLARHRATLRRSPLKALHSFLREVGDVLVGSFMQVASS
jgi:hypothetical protein